MVAWCGLIYKLGSVQSPDPGFWMPPHFDKVVHAVLFGLLALITYPFARSLGLAPFHAACLSVVFASLYGLFDEMHQAGVAGRFSSIADWIADTLGALSVFGLMHYERDSNHWRSSLP